MSGEGKRLEGGGERLFDMPSVSIAAHELKAPLALIRQLSLELQNTEDAKTHTDLFHQIQLISERSLRFTTNLSKATSLQTTIFDLSPIYPGAIIRDVWQELSPLYSAKDRSLSFRSGARLPLIATNSDLLRRILSNFVDNALHYADEDGVVELYSQLRKKDSVVRLGVRDHGPMLSSSIWKNLQGQSRITQSSRPDSSGLGLAISAQFAESIGARVGAIRHRDGASFYVDVPLSKQLSLL